MAAAQAIGDWIREGKHASASMDVVNEKVNAIVAACSFQDITGQRIRRAIQHLQQVETMLTGMAPAGGIERARTPVLARAPFNNAGAIKPENAAANPDLGQDAVDALFD